MPNIPWVLTGSATDPCCCLYCHDRIGANLDVLNTGITVCSDCYTMPGGGVDFKLSFTGVNGGKTLVWDGFASWTLVVGVLTVVTYSSTDGTCSVVDSTFDYDITQSASCTGSNVFSSFINSAAFVGATPINFGFFQDAVPAAFGVAMTNALILGGCGGISGGNGQAAYAGTVTVPTQP